MLFTAPLLSEIFPCLQSVSPEAQILALDAMGIDASLKNNRIFVRIPDNRPDLCCFNGLGRTAAAALKLPFFPLESQMPEADTDSIYESADLDVPSEACLRISAAMAVSCKVQPSPEWMQKRLMESDIRPVNNLTDIAALVTLETGIPVFLLDKRTLPEGSLVIRDSWPGEEVTLSDGQIFSPEAEIPLVSDENGKALFPAGIQDPIASQDCHEVLILTEVCLDSVMRDVRDLLGITSRNLQRNCLSLDPMKTIPALNRVCCLITTLSCGKILDGILDNLNYVPQPTFLPYSEKLSPDIKNSLKTLGFSFQDKGLILPSDRKDLASPEDLQKEIQKLQNAFSAAY